MCIEVQLREFAPFALWISAETIPTVWECSDILSFFLSITDMMDNCDMSYNAIISKSQSSSAKKLNYKCLDRYSNCLLIAQ